MLHGVNVVGGELLDDELVVRFILIVGLHDVVAVGPGVRVAVVLAAIVHVAVAADGVGVAGGIQPVARPAFAVVRAGEEAINDRFPSIRRLVRQKRIDLRRTWR